MAGTHCWNATVQREVDHAESLAEAAAGSVRAGALGATVLVPVRLSKLLSQLSYPDTLFYELHCVHKHERARPT